MGAIAFDSLCLHPYLAKADRISGLSTKKPSEETEPDLNVEATAENQFLIILTDREL